MNISYRHYQTKNKTKQNDTYQFSFGTLYMSAFKDRVYFFNKRHHFKSVRVFTNTSLLFPSLLDI